MLFKRELKRNLRSFIVSSLICSALVMYVIALAPSFGKDIQQILDLKFPKQLQMAFGMTGLDYSNPLGFFGIVFSYVYLFFSIYIAGVFAAIVSKEFSEKTAEYLFSLPAKRVNIISTKLSVAFFYAVLSIIIIFIVSLISFSVFIKENYDVVPVILMSLSWLIGGITFGALAFLLSSFYTKARTVSSLSVGLVLVMYLFQVVISINKDLDNLKYISPFDWFKGSEIANTGEISVTYCIIAAFITAVCISFGTYRFKKMDVLV
jgi:ABC-2 type transport system permease protein